MVRWATADERRNIAGLDNVMSVLQSSALVKKVRARKNELLHAFFRDESLARTKGEPIAMWLVRYNEQLGKLIRVGLDIVTSLPDVAGWQALNLAGLKGTGVDRTEQEHATELGAALQTWIERGSWGMCLSCGVLQPRPMRRGDLDCQAKPVIAKCFCKTCNGKGRLKPKKRRHCVLHHEDVPEKLRGLSQELLLRCVRWMCASGQRQRTRVSPTVTARRCR